MIGQPSLDRFSQPGPHKQYPVKVFQILPDCDVCGRRMDQKFLEAWNGIEICKCCKKDVYMEMESYN